MKLDHYSYLQYSDYCLHFYCYKNKMTGIFRYLKHQAKIITSDWCMKRK